MITIVSPRDKVRNSNNITKLLMLKKTKGHEKIIMYQILARVLRVFKQNKFGEPFAHLKTVSASTYGVFNF